MSPSPTTPLDADSTRQARRVLLVIVLFSLWAVAGLALKYYKRWIGNQQEMYPTIILPGFGRNPAKTSKYLYLRHRLIAIDDQGVKTELVPIDLLGRHWINKIDALVKAEQPERLNRAQPWLQNLPAGTQQVEAVIETRRYRAGVAASEHPLETEVRKTFHLE